MNHLTSRGRCLDASVTQACELDICREWDYLNILYSVYI